MQRKVWMVLAVLIGTGVVVTAAVAFPEPFEYGFVGGEFFEDEDAAISTWSDIHFACHFFDAQELEGAITQITSGNRALIDLGRAWQARTPSCDLNGPWGDVGLFISRIQPLLATLQAYQERLLALWIFDEPDGTHGGPTDVNLQAAIEYLHQAVPGIPVFVNWFTPHNNTRLPNADWYETTKGADPAVLSSFGKPMFLWWFNNEADPHPAVVNRRWQNMVSYFYKTTPPPIAALGWCCDSIESFDGLYNDNSLELTALVENLGRMRRETGTVARAAYAGRMDGGWYLFRRDSNGQLRYTDILEYPFYRPLPIGGTSPFYPAVSREFRRTGTWVRLLRAGEDLNLYVAWISPDDQWGGWEQIPGQTDAKPDVLRFRAVTWQAIRGLDGAVYVMRDRLDTNWLNLGGEALSAPFFKVVAGKLRVAVFGLGDQVYSREWNGNGWEPWIVEP